MISTFDLFRIGIGPSSSHTVGPMRAARRFARRLARAGLRDEVAHLGIELYGSLAATGIGHGTDKAVLLGLAGERPETVDVADAERRFRHYRAEGRVPLAGAGPVTFAFDLRTGTVLPAHPNAMAFTAVGHRGEVLARRTDYSIGGGFLLDEDGNGDEDGDGTGDGDGAGTGSGGRGPGRAVRADVPSPAPSPVPYPFENAEQLLRLVGDGSISDLMLANETARRAEAEVRARLLGIWGVMRDCVDRGCRTEGTLPGGLEVPRRAPALYRRLRTAPRADPLEAMDWVALQAIAVNEENAAGGRVVTAPTNGAAGILPAVLHHYHRTVPGADEDGTVRFLLTAAAIGIVIKRNASLSGAEVGCQGEVGAAAAMAAAGLAERMGGTAAQVESAAEIALEHHLGMTCDPVAGLVQIPCIERNAIAGVKAVAAARLALRGDGQHLVPLDTAVRTMRETGLDMSDKYKETARGGLALAFPQC
ncbi:L-serine ammonia-lyase [Kitasatospora sp. NPDC088391]|uniref:L-serine ammonia-lyase n=1 Tax=Kitasatospora sp. NPDC088391 TaxID=3364074 RepID=UPI003816B769